MGARKNKKIKQEEAQEHIENEDIEKPSKIHKRKRQIESDEIHCEDVPDSKSHIPKKKKIFENEVKSEVDISSPVIKKKKPVIDVQEEINLQTDPKPKKKIFENDVVTEVDISSPVNKKKKPVIDIQEEINLQTDLKPKKKKKKNKLAKTTLSDTSSGEIVVNGIAKNEQIKEEVMEIDIDIDDLKMENLESSPVADDPALHKDVNMPQNDLMELIRRIGVLLPDNDCLSYKCRADKIKWNDVAFSHYSATECKDTWFALQKRIRRYRILKEVLEDAKLFVLNPPKTKRKTYPGMPIKPPTGYQLFYKKKKPSLLSEEPGLDIAEISKRISQMFKNLSPEKKMKYEKQASQLKAKYEEELQIFYDNHPELAESLKRDKISDNKPVKPTTPFILYYRNQLRKAANSENKDINTDNAFKDQCKQQWKQLSMKKKMIWITKAEQDVIRYEEEMKEYVSKHPNYNHIPIKSILNKEEIALKEKFSGKPDKPPTSAYSLFSKTLLQSDEIKKITAKDRMNHIAAQWKNCTEEEKGKYRAKVDELMEQYKKDYEKYLESLPEDKRELELQKNLPKKKTESSDKKKKTKGKTEKVSEPATPPISAFIYFANSQNIQDRKIAKKEWKKLSEEEKSNYEKKLVEIKREYILQFEKFLNSLSKEELQEYSKTKQELKFNSDDFVDDDSSSRSSDDEDSDSD